MELKPWPADFVTKKAGVGCPQCEVGRVDETEHGVRYFAGSVADGYLQKRGPTAGYSVEIFRGRHVGAACSAHQLRRERTGRRRDDAVCRVVCGARDGPRQRVAAR